MGRIYIVHIGEIITALYFRMFRTKVVPRQNGPTGEMFDPQRVTSLALPILSFSLYRYREATCIVTATSAYQANVAPFTTVHMKKKKKN